MQRRSQNRFGRINEAVKEELSLILRDMKDPRMDPMTSILRCETSRDLKYCKVYYSVLGDETTRQNVADALQAGYGYIRRELAARLNLRQTPELNFVFDDSMQYSVYLSQKIDEIHQEDEERLEAMTPEMRKAKEEFEKEAERKEQHLADTEGNDDPF